jgi:hypothetical protein
LEYGNVRVGIFPQREEIFVSLAALCRITCERSGIFARLTLISIGNPTFTFIANAHCSSPMRCKKS